MGDNMTETDFTRRRMVAAAVGLVSATALPAQNAAAVLTAGEVIARIKKNIGIPWMEQTVDNLIAGSPDTPVKGIATTMMATLDVMQFSSALRITPPKVGLCPAIPRGSRATHTHASSRPNARHAPIK